MKVDRRMIDPNPEPDSLTPAEADDGSDMSAYKSVQWITPDDHQIDSLIDHDCWPEKAGDDLKLRCGQMLDAALAAHDMHACARERWAPQGPVTPCARVV